MGELRDLIGIYGGVDRAVQAHPGRRDPVSRLLPVYRREGVAWFDEFVAWTDTKREDRDADAFPSLEVALEQLEALEPPRGRMRARRLFAIAVAVQARPELLEPDGGLNHLARGALRGLVGDDDERARRLLELLGDERHLPPIEDGDPSALDLWWETVATEISSQGLMPDAERLGPRPCSGRLVTAPLRGGRVLAATLHTEFEILGIAFERAISFLAPENWPECSDFWCEMTKRGAPVGGVHPYHEVVSTDCHGRASALTIEADLDFVFTRLPGIAVTEYRLTPGPPQRDVLVDEGSLVVARIGAEEARTLHVTTTKRITFDHPFSGEQLALIMCALGYASVVEDLVLDCAALRDDESGTTFPGRSPKAARPGSGSGSVIKEIADEVAAAVKECIDDCADAAEASSEAIAEGRYTADALVQDVTRTWVRFLRDSATAVDLGARGARTAARTRDRRTPERPPS